MKKHAAAGAIALGIGVMSGCHRVLIKEGRVLFEQQFTPQQGLGPLFNQRACAECHEAPRVGGSGDEKEVVASLVSSGFCATLPDGPVIQQDATLTMKRLGFDKEQVPAGYQQGLRSTPTLVGRAQIDKVSDCAILKNARRYSSGVNGWANILASGHVGKFGRKGNVASLSQFTADAFQNEQGVTSPVHPHELLLDGQPLPPRADRAADPELTQHQLDATTAFVKSLHAGHRGHDQTGRRIFRAIGCAECHTPSLDGQRIFSDLLIHKMAPEQADICLGFVAPDEFRTEPLVDLGSQRHFMHDGSARSIEAAIEAHGGEADAAKGAFSRLAADAKQHLLHFLGSL